MARGSNTETGKTILEAACKLFAEYGYESVSTRMIAEAAGINLGSIHYHYDGKESLYVEAFRHAAKTNESLMDIEHYLSENPHLLDTPEGKSEVIKLYVLNYFHCYFSNKEDWKRRLILREMCQNSTAHRKLIEEVFKPASEKSVRLFRLLASNTPEGDSADSEMNSIIWGHFPPGLAAFYMMIKTTLEQYYGKDFTDKFYQKLAKNTAKAMIALMELPIPEDLKKP